MDSSQLDFVGSIFLGFHVQIQVERAAERAFARPIGHGLVWGQPQGLEDHVLEGADGVQPVQGHPGGVQRTQGRFRAGDRLSCQLRLLYRLQQLDDRVGLRKDCLCQRLLHPHHPPEADGPTAPEECGLPRPDRLDPGAHHEPGPHDRGVLQKRHRDHEERRQRPGALLPLRYVPPKKDISQAKMASFKNTKVSFNP